MQDRDKLTGTGLILRNMKKLNIALVAHDGRKDELLSWVKFNAAFKA